MVFLISFLSTAVFWIGFLLAAIYVFKLVLTSPPFIVIKEATIPKNHQYQFIKYHFFAGTYYCHLYFPSYIVFCKFCNSNRKFHHIL